MGNDRLRRWLLPWLLCLGWVGSGWAAEDPWVQVVVGAGELVPGRAHAIEVAAGRGEERLASAPEINVSGGLLRYDRQVEPGIWAYWLQPSTAEGVPPVVLEVEAFGERWETALPVGLPPEAALHIPAEIEGWTHGLRGGPGGGALSPREARVITVEVTGEDLPPPEALQVVVGEGHLRSVEAVEGRLQVQIEVGDSPFPRVIPVGVRDLRTDAQPAWGLIRLRARPVLPLRSDPGVSVSLGISGRSYGPFVADAQGAITAWVDQWPGESVARAVFRDDLGNETHTDLPLASSSQPWLLAVPAGSLVPGEPAPLVWLWGVAADGSPQGQGLPTCRTPNADLPVHSVGPGRWVASLLPLDGDPQDVRVECHLANPTPGGSPLVASLRVPVAEQVPSRLQMRVWPTELRADLPLAEVRVALEDLRGDRLSAEGVRVRAARGDVVLEQARGVTRRGEYVGTAAVEHGGDVVTAIYDPAERGAQVHRLRLGWEAMPAEGRWRVRARAEDLQRRPVLGAQVRLGLPGDALPMQTDGEGWVQREVELPVGQGPLVVEAHHGRIVARAAALRGAQARQAGHALTDEQVLTITAGTVAGVTIELDPPLLNAAPGAKAWVRVHLEDRSGHPVFDAPVTVDASAGRVERLRQRGDGSWVGEYVWDGSRVEDVLLTAHTDSVRSTAILKVEPQEIRVSLGPWVGGLTNLGGIGTVVLGFDADFHLRMPLLGTHGMIRLGAATYTFRGETPTRLGAPARVQSSLIPWTAMILVRRDTGGVGLFAGAGVTVALQRLELRFGDRVVSRGVSAHAGPTLAAGVAKRIGVGEVVGEVRSTWLHSSGMEFGFSGNIGGLAAGAGYRVVF